MPLPEIAHAPARINQLREAMPESGLFRGKTWVSTPSAFPISVELMEKIERLGPAILTFQRACNALYFEGLEAERYAWVTRLLDQGKPEEIVNLGRVARWRNDLAKVIRPDLILTETGVSIAELDSLPGGIGLTGWLGEMYAGFGESIVGGADGMVDGFSKTYPGHDFLISRESGDYQPEMEWLAGKLNDLEGGGRRVLNPWEVEPYELSGCDLYRFFELWDLDQVEHSPELVSMAERGELNFTAPLKAFMEEKIWLALFWSPSLQGYWRDALNAEQHALLSECIPYGWVMDPTPLPIHAEWPRLGIQSWETMKRFGNKERELVLKVSGFSDQAWGSRGVYVGHDLPQEEWAREIDRALQVFPNNPHLLQRFAKARVVAHPVWNEERQAVVPMQGRVRLCPYYFVQGDEAKVSGALATLAPIDKKLLHGMTDAAMMPCRVE